MLMAMENMAGPKSPRFEMMALIERGREESIRARRASDVPEACIIRWVVRSMCLRSSERGKGKCPIRDNKSASQLIEIVGIREHTI